MEIVLEAGADDLQSDADEVFEVFTTTEAFEGVRAALEDGGIEPAEAKLGMFPTSTVSLDEDKSRQVLRMMEMPDDFPGPRVAYLEFVRDDAPEQLLADATTLRAWLEGTG